MDFHPAAQSIRNTLHGAYMWVVGEGGSVGAPAFSSGGTFPNVCLSAQCGVLEAKASGE